MNSAEIFVGVICTNLFLIRTFYRFLFSKLERKKTNLSDLMLVTTFVIGWGSTEKLFNSSWFKDVCLSVFSTFFLPRTMA